MKIYKTSDYGALSQKAAALIAAQVVQKPNSILGLATGSSPLGTYKKLVQWYQEGIVNFSEVSSVNLDEYKGLDRDNHQSYYHFMNENFFKHIDISLNHTYIPNGMEENSVKECMAYEEMIKKISGVDLQLLGIGDNGHIAFNEPSDIFSKITHCVHLQKSTIEANKRFFASADDVPRQAYTMGCGTIMKSKKIVLIVSGAQKAEIVKKAFWGPVTPRVPASILQFHPDVTLVATADALTQIPDSVRV